MAPCPFLEIYRTVHGAGRALCVLFLKQARICSFMGPTGCKPIDAAPPSATSSFLTTRPSTLQFYALALCVKKKRNLAVREPSMWYNFFVLLVCWVPGSVKSTSLNWSGSSFRPWSWAAIRSSPYWTISHPEAGDERAWLLKCVAALHHQLHAVTSLLAFNWIFLLGN